jgi:DNA-binding transcriptional LysR family regulator
MTLLPRSVKVHLAFGLIDMRKGIDGLAMPVQGVLRQDPFSGHLEWRLLHGDEVISIRPQGRFVADNGQALVAAALAGLGIAMLPDFLTDPHVATGALVPVVADYPVPEAGLFVVRPPGDYVPRNVRVLTDILMETFSSAASRVNEAVSA